MLPIPASHSLCQVMEEGEKLAGKQAEMEAGMRKLRQQTSALEAERDKLAAKLAAEQAESAGLRKVVWRARWVDP